MVAHAWTAVARVTAARVTLSSVTSEIESFFSKSRPWKEESAAVREILLDCGLEESFKWRKPCYADDGANIAILQEMKRFLALMFFKGALLDDPGGVLEEQGKNTRSARRVCFTSVEQVRAWEAVVRDLVASAIAVERAGTELPEAPKLVLAPELQQRLDADTDLKAAFEKLTPGRQRAYNLHVSGAKQSATRARRVERHVARILAGKGLRDR